MADTNDGGAGETNTRIRPVSRRTLLAMGVAIPLASRLARLVPDSVGSFRPVEALPSGASSFVAVSLSRLADTRTDSGIGGFVRVDGSTIRVKVAGRFGVPLNATAAVLNVTLTNPTAAGVVTVYPAGTARKAASNVNVERVGQILANLVTVPLGVDGAVDIWTLTPADLVIDVNGAYVPAAGAVGAGRFVGLASTYRALDTRDRKVAVPAQAVERVDLSAVVPATATAVVVNLTVTEVFGPGFWTGFVAGGAIPRSSSVNTDAAGQTRANQAILPIIGLASIDVFSYSGGHLIVDVAGYFTGASSAPSTDGLFVPSPDAPTRVLDSREVPQYGRMYPGWVCEFDFTGRASAQAVVFNLTTSETRGPGFFTAYPARTNRPVPASNLNATTANQTIANHAIARCSSAGVAVFTYGGGDVIVDVAGYFLGQPVAATLAPVVNVIPPPPPSPLPYQLAIPAINVSDTIYEGVGSDVVDRGWVGHWPGTGFAGERSHMVLFAHRTAHGGIFRYLHLLGPGDVISITGADGRQFDYGFFQRNITSPDGVDIYDVGLPAPLPSVSLVACSRTNFEPTDTNYRIVVTFTLL
jgi:LPXTG-site transpeptidase (sortase) family protein